MKALFHWEIQRALRNLSNTTFETIKQLIINAIHILNTWKVKWIFGPNLVMFEVVFWIQACFRGDSRELTLPNFTHFLLTTQRYRNYLHSDTQTQTHPSQCRRKLLSIVVNFLTLSAAPIWSTAKSIISYASGDYCVLQKCFAGDPGISNSLLRFHRLRWKNWDTHLRPPTQNVRTATTERWHWL